MPKYIGGQPYAPAQVPSHPEGLARFLQDELNRIAGIMADLGKVAWGGAYVEGECYAKGMQVFDNGWTMIANKDTCDRPAPMTTQNPQWDLPETPAWSTNYNQSVVHSGREWDITSPSQLQTIQIWAPDAAAEYNVITYIYPTGSPEEIQAVQYNNPTINPEGWQTIDKTNNILIPGETFGVVLESINNTGSTQIYGTWTRDSNSASPPDGEWSTSDNESYIRISNVDDLGADRVAELLTVAAGSQIYFEEDQDTDRTMLWRVEGPPSQQNGYLQWDQVTFISSGDSGEPRVNKGCTLVATVPSLGPAEFVQLGGGNPSVNTRGLLEFDGTPQPGVEDDAFGVRVLFDYYDVSDDWDFVSAP